LKGAEPVGVVASSNAVEGAILIDGTIVASFAGNSATYNWDTTHAPDGTHTVQAKASNAAGNIGVSQPVTVTVSNTYRDTVPPNVAITYPLSGASVYRGWSVRITADASDNVGVTRVDFYVNSQLVCSDATPSYACSWVVPWNSSTTSYQILARAYDAAGNWRASTVTVFKSKYH
jgi:hypothetical protein